MGVKGLQTFAQNYCHNVCNMVSLRALATAHKSSYPESTPTVVVDAMGCLRTWYTPNDWVQGGQWKEYLCSLENFISAFHTAGIQLVFIFDGVIEQKKRDEWVKRRLRDNGKIAQIFHYIKTTGQQPGRHMFFIPSGISTFTKSALQLLGQEVISSSVEADYEVAAYGLQHNCLGILGEDSDYLIFDTVRYFSISMLRLDSLETYVYSRENLCSTLGLRLCDLPLLACLLGNDIIPEHILGGFQRKCTALYCSKHNKPNKRTQVIWDVAAFISNLPSSPHGLEKVVDMLPRWFDKTLLHNGIAAYVLPQQNSPWLPLEVKHCVSAVNLIESSICPDKEIVQVVLSKLQRGSVCKILTLGENECSNTLEDEYDFEIPAQALVYRPARQHVYSILLGTVYGSADAYPVVKEWYVYPGNHLLQPDIVQAVPLSIPGEIPSLRTLWLKNSPDVEQIRFHMCLACFHAESFTDELRALEPRLAALCCLMIYIALQVVSICQKDIEAFLAQVLCLPEKSAAQLKSLQLPQVESRAVHLAFLFLRGIGTLQLANSACCSPFNKMDLMPWNNFDGKLFHQKYLQFHGGNSLEEILEYNEPQIIIFKKMKKIICDSCAAKNRLLQDTKKKMSCHRGQRGGSEYSVGQTSRHRGQRGGGPEYTGSRASQQRGHSGRELKYSNRHPW